MKQRRQRNKLRFQYKHIRPTPCERTDCFGATCAATVCQTRATMRPFLYKLPTNRSFPCRLMLTTAALMTWSPHGTNWLKDISGNVSFHCFIRNKSARHQSKLRLAYIMTHVTPLDVAVNTPVLLSRNYETPPKTVQTTEWSKHLLKVQKTTFSFMYPHWTKQLQFCNYFPDYKRWSFLTETRHILLS